KSNNNQPGLASPSGKVKSTTTMESTVEDNSKQRQLQGRAPASPRCFRHDPLKIRLQYSCPAPNQTQIFQQVPGDKIHSTQENTIHSLQLSCCKSNIRVSPSP